MKKTFKSILSIVLCMMMLVGAVATGITASAETTSSGTCGDNLTWILDDSGTLTISGTGAMNSYSFCDSYAPWYSSRETIKTVVIENGVTSIGNVAFCNCTSLTGVTIPDSVTSIGSDAFYWCTGLTSINIPSSITHIDYDGFFCCSGITNIAVDPENKVYDSRNNCNAIIETKTNTLVSGCKNTVIPDDVVNIGLDAFYGCTGLTSVNVPDSVTRIDNCAFFGCKNLADIHLPSSLTFISEYAFKDTAFHDDISNWENGNVLYIGTNLIDTKKSLSGTYSIKDGTTCIASSAIFECSGLTHLIIPDSVVGITPSCWRYDEDNYWIDEGMFGQCTNLTSIVVDKNNPVYDSRDNCNAIIETETNTLVAGCKTTIIPDDIKAIGDGALFGNINISSLTIPDGVESIGFVAFDGCYFESVTIPDSVTYIAEAAFGGCSNLTDVYYTGSEADRANISIAGDNEELENATWHYNCTEPDNSFENVIINIPSSATVDYKTKVTLKATATGVPAGYYVAIYDGSSQVAKGDNNSVPYNIGSMTSGKTYTVKIVDADGNVQKDASGNALQKDVNISVNASFIKKLVAFFKGLFGSLPSKTIGA